MKLKFPLIAAFAAMLALTACGGGSDNNDNKPVVSSPAALTIKDDTVGTGAEHRHLFDLQADRGQRRREFVARRRGLDVLAQPVFGELHGRILSAVIPAKAGIQLLSYSVEKTGFRLSPE